MSLSSGKQLTLKDCCGIVILLCGCEMLLYIHRWVISCDKDLESHYILAGGCDR